MKPLVNRYMQWTYELDASYHSTTNLYSSDSIYFSNTHYRYYNVEAWAGYNINAKDFTTQEESQKLMWSACPAGRNIASCILTHIFRAMKGIFCQLFSDRPAFLIFVILPV